MIRSLRKEYLLIIFIGVLVFGKVVNFGFLSWDDPLHIYQNDWINPPSFSKMIQFWIQPFLGLYIPVSYSFWSLLALVGEQLGIKGAGIPSSGLFHGANLVLHIINTALVYRLILWILSRESKKETLSVKTISHESLASLIGALFFMLHPVQVETVAWVSTCRDLLSSIFGWISIRYFFDENKGCGSKQKKENRLDLINWNSYLKASLSFLFSLLSKPSTVALVPMLIVLNSWFFREKSKKFNIKLCLWIVLSIGIAWITKTQQPDGEVNNWTPFLSRPWIVLDSLVFYLGKIIWPIHLGLDYGRSPEVVLNSPFFIKIIWYVFAATIVLLVYFKKKFLLLYRVFFLWISALSPVLGLVPFSFQRISTVSDHYLYLSLFAFGLGIAVQVKKVSVHLKEKSFSLYFAWSGILIILSVLSIKSFFQVSVWKDNFSVFEHGIQVNPKSFSCLLHLGNEYQGLKKWEESLKFYQLAYDVEQANYVQTNIGTVLANLGREKESYIHYLKSIEINPKDDATLMIFGQTLEHFGHPNEAAHYYELAVTYNPSNWDARFNYGKCLEKLGFQNKALEQYHEAEKMNSTPELSKRIENLVSLLKSGS